MSIRRHSEALARNSLDYSPCIRYYWIGKKSVSQLRNGDSVAFRVCGRFATLCRFSQHWVTLGDLGSNWVDIRG
jgi:hypothetical protein